MNCQNINGERHNNSVGDDYNNGTRGGNAGTDHNKNTLYKRFNEFRPRTFEVTLNHLDANKWIVHMEGIFEVMGRLDFQNAIPTTFNLEGDAKQWWKTTKRTFEG